MDLKEV